MDVSSEIGEMRVKFLDAALPFVAREGWLGLDVKAAAARAELSADEVDLLFSGGRVDMADFFLDRGDELLRARAAEAEMPASVRGRIGHLIWLRLAVDKDHRDALRRTRLFFMLPPYAPRGLSCLARTSDVIWRLAGDESADFSYYTKRLILSGIFSEAATVFLLPKGEDEDYMKNFIAKRIDRLMSLARFLGQFSGRQAGKAS